MAHAHVHRPQAQPVEAAPSRLSVERQRAVYLVRAALAICLEDPERNVLERAWGIGRREGKDPQGLDAIAFDLGLPYLSVRRAYQLGLDRLRGLDIVRHALSEHHRAMLFR